MIEAYVGRTIEELKADEAVLAEALREAGADVNGRTVRCPFCDDHRPSGGIYQRQNGGFQYKCHKCGYDDSVIGVWARTVVGVVGGSERRPSVTGPGPGTRTT